MRLVLLPVIAYVFYAGAAYFLQRTLMFPRYLANAGYAGQSPPPDVRVLSIEIEGRGAVQAWYLPSERAGADRPAPAVIYFHGNGERIDTCFSRAMAPYRPLGFAVLVMEYRGYGGADGQPGERELTGDAERFRDIIAGFPEVDPQRIVYHGRSIGGGVACALARRVEPAAMVLESTFVSARAMSSSCGCQGWQVVTR